MIKSFSKFLNINIHDFHDNMDESQKYALIHQDEYFIFGIFFADNFYRITEQQFYSISDPNEFIKLNIIQLYPYSIPIDTLRHQYMGYITYQEYIEKYPEKNVPNS